MKVNYHTTFNQASIRTIYIRQYVLFYKIVQLIICTIAVGQKVSITFFLGPITASRPSLLYPNFGVMFCFLLCDFQPRWGRSQVRSCCRRQWFRRRLRRSVHANLIKNSFDHIFRSSSEETRWDSQQTPVDSDDASESSCTLIFQRILLTIFLDPPTKKHDEDEGSAASVKRSPIL